MVISPDINTRYAEYRFANPYEEFGSVIIWLLQLSEGGNGVLAAARIATT